MAAKKAERTLSRVSSASVREATTRDWDEWLATLDDAGATDWDHRTIVAHLEREHPEVDSGWWRQSIAVGYEQARGKRVVGETAYAGFQIGVQRSVTATVKQAWKVLTNKPELWLGEGAKIAFTVGEHYEVASRRGTPAAGGEVRVVKPGDRLRMTWQPDGWHAPATVQLTLSTSPSGKTTIHAHMEKLPDADARDAMRERWRAALDRIATALTE